MGGSSSNARQQPQTDPETGLLPPDPEPVVDELCYTPLTDDDRDWFADKYESPEDEDDPDEVKDLRWLLTKFCQLTPCCYPDLEEVDREEQEKLILEKIYSEDDVDEGADTTCGKLISFMTSCCKGAGVCGMTMSSFSNCGGLLTVTLLWLAFVVVNQIRAVNVPWEHRFVYFFPVCAGVLGGMSLLNFIQSLLLFARGYRKLIDALTTELRQDAFFRLPVLEAEKALIFKQLLGEPIPSVLDRTKKMPIDGTQDVERVWMKQNGVFQTEKRTGRPYTPASECSPQSPDHEDKVRGVPTTVEYWEKQVIQELRMVKKFVKPPSCGTEYLQEGYQEKMKKLKSGKEGNKVVIRDLIFVADEDGVLEGIYEVLDWNEREDAKRFWGKDAEGKNNRKEFQEKYEKNKNAQPFEYAPSTIMDFTRKPYDNIRHRVKFGFNVFKQVIENFGRALGPKHNNSIRIKTAPFYYPMVFLIYILPGLCCCFAQYIVGSTIVTLRFGYNPIHRVPLNTVHQLLKKTSTVFFGPGFQVIGCVLMINLAGWIYLLVLNLTFVQKAIYRLMMEPVRQRQMAEAREQIDEAWFHCFVRKVAKGLKQKNSRMSEEEVLDMVEKRHELVIFFTLARLKEVKPGDELGLVGKEVEKEKGEGMYQYRVQRNKDCKTIIYKWTDTTDVSETAAESSR